MIFMFSIKIEKILKSQGKKGSVPTFVHAEQDAKPVCVGRVISDPSTDSSAHMDVFSLVSLATLLPLSVPLIDKC